MAEVPWATSLGDGTWEIICKPCREQEINEKIEAFQNSEPDTEYCDEIICPHCGTKHEVDGESGAFYVDGDHEFTCGECYMEFSVYTSVSYSYTTKK